MVSKHPRKNYFLDKKYRQINYLKKIVYKFTLNRFIDKKLIEIKTGKFYFAVKSAFVENCDFSIREMMLEKS